MNQGCIEMCLHDTIMIYSYVCPSRQSQSLRPQRHRSVFHEPSGPRFRIHLHQKIITSEVIFLLLHGLPLFLWIKTSRVGDPEPFPTDVHGVQRVNHQSAMSRHEGQVTYLLKNNLTLINLTNIEQAFMAQHLLLPYCTYIVHCVPLRMNYHDFGDFISSNLEANVVTPTW